MRINHWTFRVTGFVLFASIFFTTIRLLAADDTNQWNVQVSRLQILAPVMETNTNHSERYIRTLAHDRAQDGILIPGVTVSFCVTAPKGEIADVDDDDWSLDSVTDDRGKNLLATVPWEKYYPSGEYGKYRWGYNHGEPSLFLTIRAPDLPSKGATALNINGKISVQTATGSKQFIAENVKFKPGAEFNLGNLKLTVSDARIMDKDKTFGVTLDSKQDLSNISTLEFFDGRGNEIEPLITPTGAVTSGDGDFQMVWLFHKRLDTVKIVATHWLGFKTTEVPINIKVGLGL